MAYGATEKTESSGQGDVETIVESVSLNEDDRELEALGYVPSFKREFTNLATVSGVSSKARIVTEYSSSLAD